MENLESGPYVVICQEDINASESIVGLYDFINGEGVRGFIQGRKLNENDYAVISGTIVKHFHHAPNPEPSKGVK